LAHQLQNIYTKAGKRIYCNKEKCPWSLVVPIAEPQGILMYTGPCTIVIVEK